MKKHLRKAAIEAQVSASWYKPMDSYQMGCWQQQSSQEAYRIARIAYERYLSSDA